jgi:hypothetical protein
MNQRFMVNCLETVHQIAAPHLVGPQHVPTTNIVQEEYEWKHGLGLDLRGRELGERQEGLDRGCPSHGNI